MIAILASMHAELDFMSRCEIYTEKTEGIYRFWTAGYKNIPLVFCVCGTGKVNAAVCAKTAIDTFHPDLMLSVGTCGALGESRALDVIVGTDCIQHDYDLSAFGWDTGEIPELKQAVFECDQAFVSTAKTALGASPNIRFGRVLSGDRVVTDGQEAAGLNDRFGGIAVEMEAGAIAQVCAVYQIPFGILKGVSDAGGEAHLDFVNNTATVACSLGGALARILPQFYK